MAKKEAETLGYTPSNKAKARRKSGDSARADAEAATQADRFERVAQPEALPAIMQAKVDEAKERGLPDDKTEGITRSLAMLAETMATMMKRVMSLEDARNSGTLAKPENLLKCPKCGQPIRNSTGRGICTGDHRMIQVGPKDMDAWKAFPGVRVNGVLYIGTALVPPDMAEAVIASVSRWEFTWKRLFIKGGHVFQNQDIKAMSGRIGHTPILPN